MATQMQAQQSGKSQKQRQKHRRLPLGHWVIFIVVLLLSAIGTAVWLLNSHGSWFTILPLLIFTILGVVVALFQWLFPVPTSAQEHSASPYSTSPPMPAESVTTDKTVYRGIVGLPPPTDPRTIQQREKDVKEVYSKLTQPDISAVVLTGIAGVGKSTLAALIYRYAEEQRHAEVGLFKGDPIWLSVNESVTMTDLVGTLSEVLGKSLPDLGSLTPQNQALALFNALNTVDKPRLVILDQFENLQDRQTGYTLADHPGVGEWLDALNSQPCTTRVLLTSPLWPKGTRKYPPTYMQEYHVRGLDTAEGIELLRKQGVEAPEFELQTAVERCEGHAFALTLLASLLLNHHLDLITLFKDYAQLWTGNIASNLLGRIYTQQLDTVQRKLLLAFSVYREAVPLEAVQVLTDFTPEVQKAQMLSALEALLTQHLLQASGGGLYQLHAIVADYAQEHFIEGDEQANREALQAAHTRAAQYYLHRALSSCPPREQRRQSSDVYPLIEAIWQKCQAGQWQEAYDLMEQEKIFDDLKRWGGNAILLELHQLLMPPEKWCQKRSQAIRVYKNLGRVYRTLGQKERAREHLEWALAICREEGDHAGEGEALSLLGRVYADVGDKERAREYLEHALRIRREAGDHEGEGWTLDNLARVYDDLGQKERATEYGEQALKVRRATVDRRGEGTTLGTLGRVYDDLGQKERAREYYEQALSILKKVGDRGGEAMVLNNLGRVCDDLGRREEAQGYLEEALRIRKEIGDRGGEGRTLKNLGAVYSALGEKEQAREILEQALIVLREVEDRWGEGRTFYNLGQVYADLEQKERAWEYYEQALNISKEALAHWK